MTMGGANRNKEEINQVLATADFVWLVMAGLVAMLVVWITMALPQSKKAQSEKFCYYHCLSETDKNMQGRHTTGPRYMSTLKICYKACIEEENKEKNDKEKVD
jgi:hypothetical protein